MAEEKDKFTFPRAAIIQPFFTKLWRIGLVAISSGSGSFISKNGMKQSREKFLNRISSHSSIVGMNEALWSIACCNMAGRSLVVTPSTKVA